MIGFLHKIKQLESEVLQKRGKEEGNTKHKSYFCAKIQCVYDTISFIFI